MEGASESPTSIGGGANPVRSFAAEGKVAETGFGLGGLFSLHSPGSQSVSQQISADWPVQTTGPESTRDRIGCSSSGSGPAFRSNQRTPANTLAYSTAKGTNLGKERSGNGCQSGYTPFAFLSRTAGATQVANSPLFLPRKSSSRGARLPR